MCLNIYNTFYPYYHREESRIEAQKETSDSAQIFLEWIVDWRSHGCLLLFHGQSAGYGNSLWTGEGFPSFMNGRGAFLFAIDVRILFFRQLVEAYLVFFFFRREAFLFLFEKRWNWFCLVLNHKFWNLTINWFCLCELIEAYFYFTCNQPDCGFFSFLSLDLFWYFIINIIFNGRFPSLFVGTDGCFPCFPYVRIFLFVCYFFQWQSAGSSICFLSIDRFVLVLYRLRFKRQISFLICGHGWSFFLHEEFLREDFLVCFFFTWVFF